MRDFASYLKHGGARRDAARQPGAVRRVIGFGYSQSGRFLREFVRDGFNQDERGRAAFDGLMIASAGAGGGSFNHRFASPGQAGNSVLSILRPVDLPPFTDEGLLAKARPPASSPRIFYTFSSTEYWARAGSLTHTTEDGTADVPLAPDLAAVFPDRHAARVGTAAASDDSRPVHAAQLRRAAMGAAGAARRSGRLGDAPAPSRRRRATRRSREGELVPREARPLPERSHRCRSPSTCRASGEWTTAPTFAATRVITQEPPALGARTPCSCRR